MSGWPRTKIVLLEQEVTVCFSPRTLAMIERESGLAAMEFATKFQDPGTCPIFDLGMKILLGAVRSAVPDMTEEILSERILPGTFMPILEEVAGKWAEAVAMSSAPMKAATDANPTAPGEATPSST